MAGPGGTEVGRVSVRVVPDLDGFREKIERELKQLDNLEVEIDVTLNLEKFHAQVEEVKAALKSIQDENVNIDIDKSQGLSGVGQEVKKVSAELGKLGKGFRDVDDDTDSTSKRVGFFSRLLGTLGEQASKVGQGLSQMGSDMGSKLTSGAQSASGSIVSLVASMTLWVPLLSAAAAGITYLIGLIAAALAGLPALLFGIGVPIAAIILGMDGLKNAFKVLGPEFDKIKARLSDTFEKGFKPFVDGLKPVLPVLSDGLNATAEALGKFASKTTDMLNSSFKWGGLATNMENFKNAMAGVPEFLDGLGTGFTNLLESIIRAAGQSGVLKTLGDTLGQMLTKIGGFFNQSIIDGSFIKGINNLKTTLLQITDLFISLLRNSLKFFNGAAPGMNDFFKSINNFFNRIDFEKLGKGFGDALDKVADAIDKIPPQTITSITDSFIKLADSVGTLFSGKSFDVMVAGFQLLIDIVTNTISILNVFLETLAWIGDRLSDFGDWIEGLDFGKLTDPESNPILGFFTAAKEKWDEFWTWLTGLPEKIKGAFIDAGTWLTDKGTAVINGLRDGAVTAFTTVTDFIASIPGRIKGLLASAGTWLLETGRNVINGFGQGISSGFLVIQATIISIKNRVIGFFLGAGSWLREAGSKIINGLVEGIRSAIPTIQSILGTVTRLIPSWKGPMEKDKMLLFKNGQVIMGSLVGGLKDGFGEVQSVLGGMTTELGSAFTSPTLQGDITMSGQDIAAVGTSQLKIAGSVDNGMTEAVAAALSTWTIEIDETGIARLVNKGQQRLGRRG